MLRASILAFYLLTSAATAYAECAWVLWGEHIPEPSTTPVWTVYEAYPQEEGGSRACMLARDRWEDRNERARQDWVKGGHKWSFTLYNYHCLPDTVDPRGPKGGGR